MNMDADCELSRLYRAGACEQPPVRLDRAILAAAERDVAPVGSWASARRRWSWQAPLAVAAVLSLAVSLALILEGELERMPPLRASVPTQVVPSSPGSNGRTDAEPAQSSDAISRGGEGIQAQRELPAATPQPRALQQNEASEHRAAQRAQPESMPRETPVAPAKERERAAVSALPHRPSARVSPAAPLPRPLGGETQRADPVPFAEISAGAGKIAERAPRLSVEARSADSVPPTTRREAARFGHEPDKALAVPAPGAAAAVPSGTHGPERRQADRTEQQSGVLLEAEQWLREIDQLRRDGREELARARLDQFRKRFPDFPLPESLR